jgi:transposase-like protein
MSKRIPPSERTSQRIVELLREGSPGEPEALKSTFVHLAIQKVIEELLEGEVRDVLGRDYYRHSASDTSGAGYRNGYRPDVLKTAEGAVEYSAPQVSDRDEPFRSRLRSLLSGRTDELERLGIEMYARGLSTRDIEDATRGENGDPLLSKSAVSQITEALWAEYEAFATRDLVEFEIAYLFIDGVAERLHPGQKKDAVLCAWGIDFEGKKHLLHLTPGTKEDTASVSAFLQDLKRRGLKDPLLVNTDGAGGLVAGVEASFPRSVRQRCLVHKMRNLEVKVPEDRWGEFKEHVRACYQAPSMEVARSLREELKRRYEKELPSAAQCFEDDFEACIAHLRFPLKHRRAIRTTNLLERLFGEERRRTKVIPHAFGERALLKLMFAATLRASERWRSIHVSPFERRQLEAIREELHRAFDERHKPAAKGSTPSRISSKTGT